MTEQERCRICNGSVLSMCQKGTGLCGSRCGKLLLELTSKPTNVRSVSTSKAKKPKKKQEKAA